MHSRLACSLVFSLVACAAGRLPPSGSVAEHEAAAKSNLEIAEAHERAGEDAPPCEETSEFFDICWTRPDTPQAHDELAQRHRRIAAAHQGHADALREAEARACANVAPSDRDTSPFLRSADIAEVTLLDPSTAENEREIPVVRVRFAHVPGLDEQRLRELVACHVARNAALGHEIPEMDYCPLVPPGVAATVAATTEGLEVTVTAPEASAGEVRRRAEELVRQRSSGGDAVPPSDRR